MIKRNKKIIFSLALIALVIGILTNNVFADTFDPDYYNPNPEIDNGSFLVKAGVVLGKIQYIGIIIAVVTLVIIGLRYMLCSVAEKAEYKKTMLSFVVGCFLLISISLVIGIVARLAVGYTTSNAGDDSAIDRKPQKETTYQDLK